MKKILFVDDEKQILKSLSRLFMETDYEIETAESGAEALDRLASNDFDLIVSDMRMPNMDGNELLSKVKVLYPNVMRIMLSGYCEDQIIFKALQKNLAKLYIFKPWENEIILKTIEQIFQTEDMLKSNNLLKIMNSVDNLPTIKCSYQRIINLIENEADDIEISKEIESDPAVAVKIIQVANSAFYGAKTGSIQRAITYIGLANTYNLVLSTSIIDAFEDVGFDDKNIEYVWKHAFVSNKLLAFFYEKHLNRKLPELYSTAGLFQNIGVLLLLKCFKHDYMKLLVENIPNKNNLLLNEKNSFNITHVEAGGYLLKWWDFPYPIVEAAMYHHNPMDVNVVNRELVSAVHLAGTYATQLLTGSGINELDMEVFRVLGVSKNNFEESLSDFEV